MSKSKIFPIPYQIGGVSKSTPAFCWSIFSAVADMWSTYILDGAGESSLATDYIEFQRFGDRDFMWLFPIV